MSIKNLEVGICDDSIEDLKRIQSAFKSGAQQLGEEDVILHLYQNGKSLYRDSKKIRFSLVFLDWEMPSQDGFDLARQLYAGNPELKVVFVSNYENMVFDAYEYTPLWFVRKSLLEHDMMKALRKYFDMAAKTQLRYRTRDGFGMREVHLDAILYAECSGHELMIRMKDRTVLQMYGTLKSLEEEWSKYGFIRIHKNYLVNAKYVTVVGGRTVSLADGVELDIGKNRRKAIMELVNSQKGRAH